MVTQPTPDPRTELLEEASTWAVGGAIIGMALFPLAVPALVLAAVLALPLLPLALAAVVLAVPILLLRSLARRARRAYSASESHTRSRRVMPSTSTSG